MVLDAEATAQRFANGALDPAEVLEGAISAAQSEPASFTRLMPERARFEAGQARERWRRGLPLSALDGIPVSWKDLFDVAGTPTTAASETRRSAAAATADALAVNLGARAGWSSLGKTNLSEFAFSGLGINPHFGTPPGPLARDGSLRIPGGSTSGGASAVSRGAGLIAIGSDTAGSIRIPAAFFGLVGYRPSLGRYPMTGVFPLARSFDTIGPIAHSVRDCILVDRVLRAASLDLPEPAPVQSLRLVVDRNLTEADIVAPEVRRKFEAALDTLVRAGASVQYLDYEPLRAAERAIDELGWLGAVEGLAIHRAALSDKTQRDLIDPRIVGRLERAATIRPDAVAELYRRHDEAKRLAIGLKGSFLVFPTVPHTAPKLEPLLADDDLFAQTNLATLRYCMLTSFLAMPGIALPTGFDDNGLPTSLLMSAAPGEDEVLIRGALTCEGVLRGRID